MKPSVFGAVVAVLGVVAMGLLLAGRPHAPIQAGTAGNEFAARHLTVTGEGSVSLKPDAAVIQFGLRSEGATAAEAEVQSRVTADKISAAVAAATAGAGAAQVSMGEVHPMATEHLLHTGRGTGYQAESRLQVTVHNLKLLSQVREAALAAGATDVYDTSYLGADLERARQAAIKLAMDNATARARALSLAADVALRELVNAQVELLQDPTTVGLSVSGEILVRARVTATFQV